MVSFRDTEAGIPIRVSALLPQSSPYRSTPDRERKLDTELERDMLGREGVVGSRSFIVGEVSSTILVFAPCDDDDDDDDVAVVVVDDDVHKSARS